MNEIDKNNIAKAFANFLGRNLADIDRPTVRDELLREHNTFMRLILDGPVQGFEEVELGKGSCVLMITQHPQNTYEVGWAFRSPKDENDLVKGVLIAQGRLVKRPLSLVDPDDIADTDEILHTPLRERPEAVPQWARKAIEGGA